MFINIIILIVTILLIGYMVYALYKNRLKTEQIIQDTSEVMKILLKLIVWNRTDEELDDIASTYLSSMEDTSYDTYDRVIPILCKRYGITYKGNEYGGSDEVKNKLISSMKKEFIQLRGKY